jgi:hypothetical protein
MNGLLVGWLAVSQCWGSAMVWTMTESVDDEHCMINMSVSASM